MSTTSAHKLTDSERHLLTINALEDIAAVTSTISNFENPVKLHNKIHKINAIACTTLKTLEKGFV